MIYGCYFPFVCPETIYQKGKVITSQQTIYDLWFQFSLVYCFPSFYKVYVRCQMMTLFKSYVAFILPYGISGFSYFSLSSPPMYKIAILAQGWRPWYPSKCNFALSLYSGNCERLFKSQAIRQREVLAIRVPRRLLFHVPL